MSECFTFDTHDPFIMARAYELMCQRMGETRTGDTFSFQTFHDIAINEYMGREIKRRSK